MEPEVGIEPTAFSLPRKYSTTELFGHWSRWRDSNPYSDPSESYPSTLPSITLVLILVGWKLGITIPTDHTHIFRAVVPGVPIYVIKNKEYPLASPRTQPANRTLTPGLFLDVTPHIPGNNIPTTLAPLNITF